MNFPSFKYCNVIRIIFYYIREGQHVISIIMYSFSVKIILFTGSKNNWDEKINIVDCF